MTPGDHRRFVVARFARFHPIGTIAELAIGAGDEHRAHPLVAVAGQHATCAEGLVVGVGVDGHQRQRFTGHRVSLSGPGSGSPEAGGPSGRLRAGAVPDARRAGAGVAWWAWHRIPSPSI